MTDRDILEAIKIRNVWRKQISYDDATMDQIGFFLICECLDNYIEHRIESDNAMLDILKDIQNNQAQIAESDNAIQGNLDNIDESLHRIADQNDGFFGDAEAGDESNYKKLEHRIQVLENKESNRYPIDR